MTTPQTLTDYSRQEAIITPKQLAGRPMTIIGVGGIGSMALMGLVKLGVRQFVLYDPDRVEAANGPNQAYEPSHVGMLKVKAAAELLHRYGATSVTAHHCEYAAGQAALEGFVLCGVDSIATRAEIWPLVRGNSLVELYFDGRLGGEELRLLTVNPNDPLGVEQEYYERSLFKPEHAAQQPCGGRAVIGPAGLLGGILTGQLTRFIREEPFFNDIRLNLTTMAMTTGRWSS